LGFNPSTFSSNFSSASKNWGFEIINGAATQGYLYRVVENRERAKKSFSNYNGPRAKAKIN
jgi:hypothetical protein